jgi:hypothetical protein
MKAFIYLFSFLLFFQTTNKNDCKIETSMNESICFLLKKIYNENELKDEMIVYSENNKNFSKHLNMLKKDNIFKERKYLFFPFLSSNYYKPYSDGKGQIIGKEILFNTSFGKILSKEKIDNVLRNRHLFIYNNLIERYQKGFKTRNVDSVYIKLQLNNEKWLSENTPNYGEHFKKKYEEAVKNGLFLTLEDIKNYENRLFFVIIEKNEIQKTYFIDNTYFG